MTRIKLKSLSLVLHGLEIHSEGRIHRCASATFYCTGAACVVDDRYPFSSSQHYGLLKINASAMGPGQCVPVLLDATAVSLLVNHGVIRHFDRKSCSALA